MTDPASGSVEVAFQSAPPASTDLGATTARSLLLTVLGQFALPTRRSVRTSVLIRLLGDLGVSEKATRQAIMRVNASGLIEKSRIGRESCWSLGEAGTWLLRENAQRMQRLATRDRPWDSRWLIIIGVPKPTGRTVGLRPILGWSGSGISRGGAWVTPWVDREDEVIRMLDEVNLLGDGWSFVATVGQIGDGRSLARAAWNLDGIACQYHLFLDRLGRMRPETDRQALAAFLRLMLEWGGIASLDPALPCELLPPRWSGLRALDLFRERHARWAPRAQRAWAELDRGN